MSAAQLHIVIEAAPVGYGHTYRAVTPPVDWRTAQDEWVRLEQNRWFTEKGGYYMVRDNADPDWAYLARPRVFKASKDHRAEHATDADLRAARAFAKVDPYGTVRGNKGGWLYRENQTRPMGQGWTDYMSQLKRRGAIRVVPGTVPVSSWNHEPMPSLGDWMILPDYEDRPEVAV